MLKDAIRDWKRRSNGRKDGVGLPKPGREANDGKTLLLGEDRCDPYACQIVSLKHGMREAIKYLDGWRIPRRRGDGFHGAPGSPRDRINRARICRCEFRSISILSTPIQLPGIYGMIFLLVRIGRACVLRYLLLLELRDIGLVIVFYDGSRVLDVGHRLSGRRSVFRVRHCIAKAITLSSIQSVDAGICGV